MTVHNPHDLALRVQGDKRHLNTAVGLGKVLPVSSWVLPISVFSGDGLLHEVVTASSSGHPPVLCPQGGTWCSVADLRPQFNGVLVQAQGRKLEAESVGLLWWLKWQQGPRDTSGQEAATTTVG